MDAHLIVYNICEIHGQDKSDLYINALTLIYAQQTKHNFQVVVSGCMVSYATKKRLKNSFPKALFSYIEEPLSVNITFNKTILECVKKYGPYKSYIYLDSGLDLINPLTLDSLINKFYEYENEVGILYGLTNNDTGGDIRKVEGNADIGILPIGTGLNLHCALFTPYYFEKYNHLLPDIFNSGTSESIYTYLTGAIDRKVMVVSPNIFYIHHKASDGPSLWVKGSGIISYKIGSFTVTQMALYLSSGVKYGFGYEEWKGLLKHKTELWDGHKCQKENELYEWIKTNVYLNKELLNYDEIKYEMESI